jgi:hypothetical protein
MDAMVVLAKDGPIVKGHGPLKLLLEVNWYTLEHWSELY